MLAIVRCFFYKILCCAAITLMLHVVTRLFYSLQFYILRFAVSRLPTCILGTGARLIITGRLPFKPGIVFLVVKVVQALWFVNKQSKCPDMLMLVHTR